MKLNTSLAASILMLATSSLAYAAGEHSGGHGAGIDYGKPGTADHIDRTMEIIMTDNLFSMENIQARAGETIRFLVRNDGEFLHEFSIGTYDMHMGHRDEMMKMMGMADEMTAASMSGDHEDPNSLLLDPGQSGELIWTFGKNAELQFACNVPGHYEAGMWGELTVK